MRGQFIIFLRGREVIMELEEAKKVVEQMYQVFRGTLQEHQVVQEALKTLFDATNNKK